MMALLGNLEQKRFPVLGAWGGMLKEVRRIAEVSWEEPGIPNVPSGLSNYHQLIKSTLKGVLASENRILKAGSKRLKVFKSKGNKMTRKRRPGMSSRVHTVYI